MVRTQLQLPDIVHAELKAMAKEREMSIAELVRRGLEQFLDTFPHASKNKERKFPVFDLGPCNLSHAELKAIAQRTLTEERLIEETRQQLAEAA